MKEAEIELHRPIVHDKKGTVLLSKEKHLPKYRLLACMLLLGIYRLHLKLIIIILLFELL